MIRVSSYVNGMIWLLILETVCVWVGKTKSHSYSVLKVCVWKVQSPDHRGEDSVVVRGEARHFCS